MFRSCRSVTLWLLAAAFLLGHANNLIGGNPPPNAGRRPVLDSGDARTVDLLDSLRQQAIESLKQGQVSQAQVTADRVLQLTQEKYPAEKFSHGHRERFLAFDLQFRVAKKAGDAQAMVRWSGRELAQARLLYPVDRLPDGNGDWIAAHANALFATYRTDGTKAKDRVMQQLDNLETLCRKTQDSADYREFAKACYELGSLAIHSGQGRDGVQFAQRSVALYKSEELHYSPDQPTRELASSLMSLGHAYRISGQLDQSRRVAEESCRTALACHQIRPADKLGTSVLVNALFHYAITLRQLREFTLASTQLDRACRFLDELPKTDAYTRTARTSIDAERLRIAIVTNQVDEIRQLANALKGHLETRPTNDAPRVEKNRRATLLREIGLALQKTGALQESEQCYLQCLRLFGDSDVGTHPPETKINLLVIHCYLGNLHQDLGEYRRAYLDYGRALHLVNVAFPDESDATGIGLRIMVVENMANQCWLLGDQETAKKLFLEAKLRAESLFGLDRFPNGHPYLPAAYIGLSAIAAAEREFDSARLYLVKAKDVADRLVKRSSTSRRSSTQADCLLGLADVAAQRGRYASAEKIYRDLLDESDGPVSERPTEDAMFRASTLALLGDLCRRQERFDEAREWCRQSLDLRRKIFPISVFGSGHPKIATGIRYLARVELDAGNAAEAFRLWRSSAVMEEQHVRTFFSDVSDTELLRITASRFRSFNDLLLAWRHTQLPAADVYPFVWRRRAVALRMVAARQHAMRSMHQGGSDGAYAEYVAIKRTLSDVMADSMNRVKPWTDQKMAQVRQWNARKESLERKLTNGLTDPEDIAGRNLMADQLAATLPNHSALVEFVRFGRREAAVDLAPVRGKLQDPQLGAFVVAPGQPVAYVDLGPADAVTSWRNKWEHDLENGTVSDAGEQFRRLVWDPIRQRLPKETSVVYLAPESSLARVAWAALPRRTSPGYLIEEFAIALVPSGQFLLDQLQHPTPAHRAEDAFFAVGGVNYRDAAPNRPEEAKSATREVWPALPASQRELDCIRRVTGTIRLTTVTGDDATYSACVHGLQKARWAHLATHGYFLDHSSLPPVHELIASRGYNGLLPIARSPTLVDRNPMVCSGLVLAHANAVSDQWGSERARSSALSAEEVTALDCSELELVVLSACNTAMGHVAPQDGVLGIQDAFHIAGARNVVASMWPVGDEATADLMQCFYSEMWIEGRSPLEALRNAQLRLIRQPRKQASDDRGPNLKSAVPLPNNGPVKGTPDGADPRHWAAFILSGPGL